MQEMMETGTWGESLFLLYLEDLSRGIWWRTTRTSLREAHRALIAFCTRAMAGLEGEARRAAAGRLCVLRGYATGAVGEADADGEDALVRAAADGAVGAAGVRLLMEAGVASGGEALVAAATHGQREAAAGLIDYGVDVDSRAKEVMQTQSADHDNVDHYGCGWICCSKEGDGGCCNGFEAKTDLDWIDHNNVHHGNNGVHKMVRFTFTPIMQQRRLQPCQSIEPVCPCRWEIYNRISQRGSDGWETVWPKDKSQFFLARNQCS